MAAHWPTPPGGWPPGGWPPSSAARSDAPTDDWTAAAMSGWTRQPAPATPLADSSTPSSSRPKHLPVILSIVAGLIVFVCLAGAVAITTVAARHYRKDHRQLAVGMEQPVRDGSFQFTADGMRCGVQSIGTPDEQQSPTGQFCVVTLTVKNVGSSPAVFADSIQKAYGPGGVWFSADTSAGFYANPDPTIFLNEINPGNMVKAVVVYDIPQSGRIMRLEVHENPWTPGALIKIS